MNTYYAGNLFGKTKVHINVNREMGGRMEGSDNAEKARIKRCLQFITVSM